jgi:hypothetical protein
MTAPPLPRELIQQIARHLNLADLLRCKQVSKQWYRSIPGDDSVLYERLFHGSRTTQSGKPFLFIHMLIRDYRQRQHDGSSKTAFALSIETLSHAESGIWHPIASNIGRYLDVITGARGTAVGNMLGVKERYAFSSLEELGTKTRNLRERLEATDGAWRDDLVCVPSTRKLRLAVRWKSPRQICAGVLEPVDLHLTNESGVRMGQVADAIREQLERAPGEMSVCYPVLPLYDFGDWDRTRGW